MVGSIASIYIPGMWAIGELALLRRAYSDFALIGKLSLSEVKSFLDRPENSALAEVVKAFPQTEEHLTGLDNDGVSKLVNRLLEGHLVRLIDDRPGKGGLLCELLIFRQAGDDVDDDGNYDLLQLEPNKPAEHLEFDDSEELLTSLQEAIGEAQQEDA